MGFILFFFNHKKWTELYYTNCSLLTLDEWNKYEDPNHIPIGIFYMTLGMIFEILYVPFMAAMLKPEFIQYSCYKFMFFLGIIDMFAVPADSIIGGIQAILGIHYCAYPTFFYLIGCVSITCYLGATMVCVLLAFDRFFEIIFPEQAKVLFHPRMIPLWFSVAIGYMIYFWFQRPTFFSGVYLANYLDPFIGIPGMGGNEKFYGDNILYLVINSFLVNLGIGAPYLFLCIFMVIKAKLYPSVRLSKLQRVMFLQSLAICGEVVFISTVYIFNQYYEVPDIVIKLENTTWYCMHGDTPIVYLLLNASLRKKFFQMLRSYTAKSGKTMIRYMTSVYPTRVTPHGTVNTNPTDDRGLSPHPNATES